MVARPLAITLAALLAALWLPATAGAQEEPAEQVRMSLDRYARLMAVAQRRGAAQAAWGRGQVRVTVTGPDVVSVQVQAPVFLAGGDGPAEVPLIPADVVLQQVTIDGSEAPLLLSGGVHSALLASPAGRSTVVLRYLVPATTGDDGAPYAMVPLPPLPGADLVVSGGREPTVWPGSGVSRGGDSLTAALPATSAALVRWGGGAGTTGLRRIDYVLTPDGDGDGLDVAATYDVQIGGRQGTVRLAAASAALVDVREAGKPVQTRVVDGWHTAQVEGAGRHQLEVRFRLAIDRTHGNPQVVLTPDNVPMARVELTVPGKREVVFEPAVPLSTTVRGEDERAITTAVGHLPPVDQVVVRWTEARIAPEAQVRYGTETYQLFTLDEGVLRSKVIVRYEVIHGKLRELPIALPEDVIPFKVTGEGIEDWRVFPAAENEPRHLRVALGQELEGKLELQIQLERPVEPVEGTPIQLPVVRPLGAFRELGVVALFDGDKVGFAPADTTGFTKVGQDALPPDVRQTLRDKVNQAFKHVGEPGTLRSRVATAKAREVRFDARVDTLYLVRERSLTGYAAILIELKSGRNDKLYVSLPAEVAEPRITAPSLNKVEPAPEGYEVTAGRKAYEVRFTQALEGAIQLDVEFEQILAKDADKVPLPDVIVHGAEVETGSFGIAAETGMEVQAGQVNDLRRVEIEELPKAVRLRSDQEIRLGYHFTHVPWALELVVKRHRTVETLNAVGHHVWLETSVLEAGKVVTRATYEIENEDRQFVRLRLPETAKVLRVTADGQKVKAVADDSGAIAIRLPKGRVVRVELTYEVDRDKLGFVGGVDLFSPEADLRTSDVQWLVHLPRTVSVMGADTELKSVEPWNWRPPSATVDGSEVLPTSGPTHSFLFIHAVNDPDVPLKVDLTYAAAPGGGVDVVLLLLALVPLAVVTRRRGRRQPMRAAEWLLLTLGAGLLVLKTAGWGLSGGEALLAIFVLLVVGFLARFGRPAREAGA